MPFNYDALVTLVENEGGVHELAEAIARDHEEANGESTYPIPPGRIEGLLSRAEELKTADLGFQNTGVEPTIRESELFQRRSDLRNYDLTFILEQPQFTSDAQLVLIFD